jgi:tRNA1Val (adenine37-N6)-methyltransferase
MEALLLASFTLRHGEKSGLLLDLGCGCGVVGLAVLISAPHLRVCGLDIQQELILSARENAAKLGFSHEYTAACVDLAGAGEAETLPEYFLPGKVGLVAANPPYRLPGQGRLPKSASRKTALFGDRENLRAFIRFAALMLAPSGKFCLVFPFARLDELKNELAAQSLYVADILPVRIREDEAPRWSLLAAAKNMTPQKSQAFSPALTLYTGPKALREISKAALSFCPYLACNAQPRI